MFVHVCICNVLEPVGSATTVLVERLRTHIEKRKGAADSLAYIIYIYIHMYVYIYILFVTLNCLRTRA